MKICVLFQSEKVLLYGILIIIYKNEFIWIQKILVIINFKIGMFISIWYKIIAIF